MRRMSAVISFRVPRRLKEEIEKLGLDYASELRAYLEELVRRKKAEALRREMDSLREDIGRIEGNLAAEFIREERDAH
ncbi:MAG: antitoxin [Infirmifilum sp.]|nr:hypothetical protein [Infirmifilum uzonense]